MTLDQQIQLIDVMILQNPDATIRDYKMIIKHPRKAKEMLIGRAQIVLNKIAAERYKGLKDVYACTTGVQ